MDANVLAIKVIDVDRQPLVFRDYQYDLAKLADPGQQVPHTAHCNEPPHRIEFQIVNAIAGGGTRHVTTLKRAGVIADNRSLLFRAERETCCGISVTFMECFAFLCTFTLYT